MDITPEEHNQAYLNKWFVGMHDQITEKGEPNCFLILRSRASDGQVDGGPLGVYGTRDGLCKHFTAVAQQLDPKLWRVTTAACWFDD